MDNAKFRGNSKRDVVHQVAMRGYPVSEVSQRLAVSTHSLFAWVNGTFAERLLRQGCKPLGDLNIICRSANEVHFHPKASADFF